MSTWNPKANEIFLDAVELASDERRSAFLKDACQGDDNLRAEVESLLNADQDAPSIFDQAGQCSVTDMPPAERAGETIGPFTLGEKIGEGGMGVVYAAEQTHPICRTVALKIIKSRPSNDAMTARFEVERQAMAMMEHPNIAKVYDGGADEHGQPYIAMELVKGLPIHEFCDQNNMSINQRLKLLEDVCRAVQHAHQKGIIHRDLKPSNVLVAEIDETVFPKVIDFGVAKAVGSELIEQTIHTSLNQMIGTPLYMSPEQTRMGMVDVDTRSDVYSLGVMLYELLTGTTPFDSDKLKQVGFDEMRRIIQEEEPSRPSKQVSTLSAQLRSTVAERRAIDHRQLSNTLQGELDWIASKALAKDRDRRYQSAGELAEEIGRYLCNEPVEAHPPSVSYRFGKFVRRNAGLVGAIAAILLCLVAGIIGTTWGMMQARHERDTARIAQQNEEQQRQKADANAERAERAVEAEKAVLDFVEQRIFAAARPSGHDGGLGYKATIRQAVEAALPVLQSSFEEQPLLKARLHETIGLSFLHLGEGELATNQFQNSYSIRLKQLGPDDLTTLESLSRLAFGYDELGNYDKALKLKETVFERKKEILGDDHSSTVDSMVNIAVTFNRQQQYEKATELLEEAYSLLKSAPESEQKTILRCITTLASSYRNVRQFDKAASLHEEAFKLSTKLKGADHPDTLGTMHELAHSKQTINLVADANMLLQRTFDLQTAKLGPGHPDTLKTAECLAGSHVKSGNHKGANATFNAILEQQQSKRGHDDLGTVLTMSRLAISYFKIGEFDKATELHQKVYQLRRDRLGENDPATLSSLSELALCQAQLQRYDEAIKSLESLLSKCRELLPADHFQTLGTTYNLAKVCWDAGRINDAVTHYEDAINRMQKAWGPQDPRTLNSTTYFAWLLTTIPDYDNPTQALSLANELLQTAPNDPSYLRILGAAQLRNGDPDKAIESINRSIEIRTQVVNCSDWFILAIAEAKRGNQREAETYFESGVKLMDQHPQSENQEFKRYRAEASKALQIPNLNSETAPENNEASEPPPTVSKDNLPDNQNSSND